MTLKYYRRHGSVRTVPPYFTLSSENINNTFCWSLTFLRKKKPQGHIQIQYFPVSQTTPGGTTGEHTALGDKLYFLHQNNFFKNCVSVGADKHPHTQLRAGSHMFFHQFKNKTTNSLFLEEVKNVIESEERVFY